MRARARGGEGARIPLAPEDGGPLRAILMASWRRITGVAGLAVGAAVAAGAGAILAAERIAIGRARLQPDPEADEPLGQLRGRVPTVLADAGGPPPAAIDGPGGPPRPNIFWPGH